MKVTQHNVHSARCVASKHRDSALSLEQIPHRSMVAYHDDSHHWLVKRMIKHLCVPAILVFCEAKQYPALTAPGLTGSPVDWHCI